MKYRKLLLNTIPSISAISLILPFCGCTNISQKPEQKQIVQPEGQAKGPNLLIIFPDQMRAQVFEEPAKLPNLKKFAAQSVQLTEAVSNYPVSSPTRAMLMTGQYPVRNGVTENCQSKSAPYNVELNENAIFWSDVLAQKGYSTGYIGKWHLDAPYFPYIKSSNNRGTTKWNEWCPAERRHNFNYWYAYGTYDAHLKPMYWDTYSSRDEYHYIKQWGPEHEADQAINFITNKNGKYRNPDQPFALVVSMNPPHTPYNAIPNKYKRLYKNMDLKHLDSNPAVPPAGTKYGDHYRKSIKNYLAAVTGIDEQFG